MVDIDKAVLAKMEKEGKNFEILVDCEKAMGFREGKCGLGECLATNEIFADVKKGLRASEHDLVTLFGTSDSMKVSEAILKHGVIQLTQEYRSKVRDEKKKKIVMLISKQAVDPKTGFPHPPQRVERALEEARVAIDESKSAEDQLQQIVSKLRPILPIKFEIRQIAIKVSAAHGAKCYSTIKGYGHLLKDEWQNDGSLVCVVEIPAGMQEDLYNQLNKLTHGEVETKILNTR